MKFLNVLNCFVSIEIFKMSLLKCIANVLLVADVPELVVQFLAGDSSLDEETVNIVFTRKYIKEELDATLTFLDKQFRILHSFQDQPAIHTGHLSLWCSNGKLHRSNDLPAVVYKTHREWWSRGKRHRENDKPAAVYHDGKLKLWFRNGVLHRENDKPAVVDSVFHYKEWRLHGLPRRRNGLPVLVYERGGQNYASQEGRIVEDSSRQELVMTTYKSHIVYYECERFQHRFHFNDEIPTPFQFQ